MFDLSGIIPSPAAENSLLDHFVRQVDESQADNGLPQKYESHMDRVSTGSGSDLVNHGSQES